MERTRLWNRDFVLYVSGIASAALGDAMAFVALPFLVLAVSGEPRAVATTVMLASLPRFLGPLIGSLADRWHLRLPLLAGASLRFALYAALGGLALGDRLGVGPIYLAAILNGALTTFVFAAGNVLVPALVPRELLARANGIMQAAVMGLPLVGLGVAGAIVAALGPATTVLLASPAFLVLAVVALVIRFPAPSGSERPALLRDMAAGVGFVAQIGPLALLLPLTLLLNASLAMLNALMPVLMEGGGHGARGYGLFESAVSVGMLLGILAVGTLASRVPPQHQISLAQGAMAAGFAVLAFDRFWPMVGGGAVLGFGIGFAEVASITLLQLAVPDGMRGRVIGVFLTANALGLTSGSYLAGMVVGELAAGSIFLVSALATLAFGLVYLLLTLRNGQRVSEILTAGAASAGD